MQSTYDQLSAKLQAKAKDIDRDKKALMFVAESLCVAWAEHIGTAPELAEVRYVSPTSADDSLLPGAERLLQVDFSLKFNNDSGNVFFTASLPAVLKVDPVMKHIEFLCGSESGEIDYLPQVNQQAIKGCAIKLGTELSKLIEKVSA